MKIIPLRWRGAGVGCSGTGRTHPGRLKPSFPSRRGDFHGSLCPPQVFKFFTVSGGCRGMSCVMKLGGSLALPIFSQPPLPLDRGF